MVSIALFSEIGEWAARHNWGLGFTAAVVALFVVFETPSLWREQKQKHGWRRTWTNLKLAMLWLIPASAFVAWFANDRANDAMEAARIKELSIASNEIAELRRRLPESRRLTKEAAEQVIAKLRLTPIKSVLINASADDQETMEFAFVTMGSLFQRAGIMALNGRMHGGLFYGITVFAKNPDEVSTQDALKELFRAIHQNPKITQKRTLDDSTLEIRVGLRPPSSLSR